MAAVGEATGGEGGPAFGDGAGEARARPVQFSSMPYAVVKYGRSAQADAVATNALTTVLLHTHEFRPTRFGRLVSLAMDRLKLGLSNALLAVAGVVHGCASDAGTLALLLESCGGELHTLWMSGDRAPSARSLGLDEGPAAAGAHESLLRVFRERAEPAGGPGELASIGLAPGPWLGIRDAVRSGAQKVAAFGDRFADELRQSCPPRFAGLAPKRRTGQSGGSGPALRRAVVAARGFNAARLLQQPGGSQAVTLNALRPMRCDVRPLLGQARRGGSSEGDRAKGSKGRVCVFEQLVIGAGGAAISGISLA